MPAGLGFGAFDTYNAPPQQNYSGGGGGYNTQGPLGAVNTQSANTAWLNSFQDPNQMWQGPAPGHIGQNYSYNPFTDQGGWVNTAGGLQIGGADPYGKSVVWTDPNTGMKAINPGKLEDLFGSFGLGGSGGGTANTYSAQTVTPSSFTAGPAPDVSVAGPTAYGGFDWDAQEMIDPAAVIAAQEYKLQEAMANDFAQAGGRAGQSGFAMSTPYANALGEASRKAAQDRNAITLEYQFGAATDAAKRQLQQQLAQAQMEQAAWEAQQQMQMQANLANAMNALNLYGEQNKVGMFNAGLGQEAGMFNANAANQAGMFNAGAQNDFDLFGLQQQQQQQNFIASLLGGLL